MDRFIVMCQVSGGVTGFRQSPMKNRDGSIKYFETREEAEAEAKKSRDSIGYNSAARFHYWAELA